MTRFRTIVCPSIWGWYAELIFRRVPLSLNSSCQKPLMNKGSRSKMRLRGMPWILLTISMNRMATIRDVWWVGNIPKWIPYENLLTTTRMAVLPWKDGKPVIKSSERSSHDWHGTGNEFNKPATLLASYFLCWQSKQVATNCSTSLWSPGQSKFSVKHALVLLLPICPSIGVEWYSWSNVCMKLDPGGSQMHPFLTTQSGWASALVSMSCRNWMNPDFVRCLAWVPLWM